MEVADDRSSLLNSQRLFGDEVFEAFPSAELDIQEAANCLACECSTAAVFHLMRASEFALRALARDRTIEFADKPLDHKEWGQILPKLDAVVRDLRERTPSDAWPDPYIREQQISFYYEVVHQFRAFNEIWRRHVSHADPSAFYSRGHAKDVFDFVKNFMQKLSTRIAETKTTETYWKV